MIQSLHTTAAFEQLGWRVRLYVPTWRGGKTAADYVQATGINRQLDIRASWILHPRFKFHPFVRWHRRELQAADVLYTRVPEISMALASANLRHHLEIHETIPIDEAGLMEPLLAHHRAGTIGTFITISQADAQRMIERGADADRVMVAPSGVDLEMFAPIGELSADRLEQPRLLYCGSLSVEHGLHILDGLAGRGGYAVTVAGIQHGPLPTTLRVLGRVAHRDVPALYKDCEIAVMPYQPQLRHARSISPVKLFEAMATGRPIIISDMPAIREIVEHKRTALLVPPDDVDAWIDAVRLLQQDRELAMTLARNARAQADQYTWLNRARRIAEAIAPA